MINHPIRIELPEPWREKTFETTRFGTLNVLVGPNGSGKSRFAEALRQTLPNARLLGTDRLSAMASDMIGLFGDQLRNGLAKNWFGDLQNAGLLRGSGIDSFVILEERPDIR